MSSALSTLSRAGLLGPALLLLGGAALGQNQEPQRGETLPVEAWGPVRHISVRELHELEKLEPRDTKVHRLRGDARGVWTVPSESGLTGAASGTIYITNKWGDPQMGIDFQENIDLDGAWMIGQTGPAVWADELVVIGYRAGVEVARTEAFSGLADQPVWFPMDLRDVDRVVFEANGNEDGAAWFGLDDLSFRSARGPVVLDFEDLEPRDQLTGSGYAGLVWEVGTGEFDDAEFIEQPLTDGSEHLPPGVDVGGDGQALGGSGTAPTLVQDFVGAQMFDTGANYIPPDTCGVVTPNHFVEVVNTNLSIFDRSTQSRVINLSLQTFFGAFAGDPRVAWDHFSNRTIILATDFSSRIYLAVSDTDDPTGTWFTTSFLTNGGSDAGRWPDYPTLGFDQNGIYTCIGQFGGSPVTMSIFALDKAPLLGGSLGTVTAWRGFSWESAIQPAFTHGTPGRQYFLGRGGSTSLTLREVLPPLTSPTLNSLGNVTIPFHAFPPDVDVLGASTPLDSVDYRLMNAVYRNGALWAAHAIEVSGRAGVRWYEIDANSGTLNQYGTISDSDLGFVMPSLAVNANEDVVLAFSGASPSTYGAAYYTGRANTDPSGEMAMPILLKAGEAAYERTDSYGRNRWGDYSLTSVDPVDDLTFWTVQEYAWTGNRWSTWIAELAYSTITDCNNNGVEDSDDISNGTSQDCNANGVPDECELDCDSDGVPDECEVDCNSNGVPDECETFSDCNSNGIPDECEADCDADGTPDDCEVDCNANGTPDDCESFSDCDSNGVPDECQADCDSDGTPDACEADCNSNGTPDDCETFSDCNSNGIPDECEADCDSDGTPDDCETDCNANGTPDDCESFSDCDSNGVPDECQADCDSDGTPDACEADCNSNGTPDDCESFSDCDSNGVPDECQADCDADGTPDACEADCNANGTPDDCESFSDCNSNGVPDDCEADCDADGTPDDCEVDCNANGTPDDCESFSDCDSNGVPDECQADCDSDGTPDACEADCNANGTPDDCESFSDCDSNGVPDECQADCDSDGTPDACEADCNANGTPDDCESFSDCNSNGIPDECEADCDADGTPDDCEVDCNANGTPDDCESFTDCDANGVPDECQADCDTDGTPDACEADCNANGTPDDCESFSDCNSNGVPDECDPDSDGDGTPDDCEIGTNYCGPAVPNSAGTSAVISADGSTVVADDDLTLTASQMPIFKFGYFLVSETQAFVPNPGGSQGNLCLGGTIGRYKNDVLTSDISGAFSLAIDLNSLPGPLLVPVMPGDTWNWQAWYRDNNPNPTSNFTDAISITFQ